MQQNPRPYMPLLNPVYPPGYQNLFMDVKKRIEAEQYTKETNQMIEKLLTFNPSNYTIWVAKKRILEAGQTDIVHEDQYSEEVLLDNVKNFQLWDYRNFIVSHTKNYQRQYQIMDKILKESPKNYHLWSNRVTLVNMAGNFAEQIENTAKYIHYDPYNNSVWAYRFYCTTKILQTIDFKKQLEFVCENLEKHLDNEALWNYLRGFFPSYKIKLPNLSEPKSHFKYEDYPEVQEFCKKIVKQEDILEKKKIQTFLTISIIDSQQEETMKYAKEICELLAGLEPERANYYHWLKEN